MAKNNQKRMATGKEQPTKMTTEKKTPRLAANMACIFGGGGGASTYDDQDTITRDAPVYPEMRF